MNRTPRAPRLLLNLTIIIVPYLITVDAKTEISTNEDSNTATLLFMGLIYDPPPAG